MVSYKRYKIVGVRMKGVIWFPNNTPMLLSFTLCPLDSEFHEAHGSYTPSPSASDKRLLRLRTFTRGSKRQDTAATKINHNIGKYNVYCGNYVFFLKSPATYLDLICRIDYVQSALRGGQAATLQAIICTCTSR